MNNIRYVPPPTEVYKGSSKDRQSGQEDTSGEEPAWQCLNSAHRWPQGSHQVRAGRTEGTDEDTEQRNQNLAAEPPGAGRGCENPFRWNKCHLSLGDRVIIYLPLWLNPTIGGQSQVHLSASPSLVKA